MKFYIIAISTFTLKAKLVGNGVAEIVGRITFLKPLMVSLFTRLGVNNGVVGIFENYLFKAKSSVRMILFWSTLLLFISLLGKDVAPRYVSVNNPLKLEACGTTFLDSLDKLVRTGIAFALETCFPDNWLYFRISVCTNRRTAIYFLPDRWNFVPFTAAFSWTRFWDELI